MPNIYIVVEGWSSVYGQQSEALLSAYFDEAEAQRFADNMRRSTRNSYEVRSVPIASQRCQRKCALEDGPGPL